LLAVKVTDPPEQKVVAPLGVMVAVTDPQEVITEVYKLALVEIVNLSIFNLLLVLFIFKVWLSADREE